MRRRLWTPYFKINGPLIRVTHYMPRPEVGAYSLKRTCEDLQAHLPVDIRVSTCTSRFLSRGLFGRLYDIVRARFHQGDVNHITGDAHFLTYLLNRRRTILTILDCVMLERLHGFKRWLFWLLWFWLPEKRCASITVISEATRKQVLRHLRCDPDKVRVIYCNVSEEFKEAPLQFNVSRPRLLQVGTAVNKNLERVAAALQGLDCEIAIIGRLSVAQIVTLERHGVSYENFVDLSREAVVEQYQRCDMMIFASIYEGFGLPIVEANAVGRPVVTSNIWSMPEVAGGAACLVDPFDVASIRAGICRVIGDSVYREHLVKKGLENVKRFHIENIARQYAQLYGTMHTRYVTIERGKIER
jgi:glycosyltransferase involved in cell wall biosynthesis